MRQAKSGDQVQVHYTGTFDDGEQFDCTRDEDEGPFEVCLGNQEVIPGFDAAVLGMTVGEVKTVRIPCAEAYGPLRPDEIYTMPRSELPDDFEPKVGATLMLDDDGEMGEPRQVILMDFDDESVTLDGNHPLVGRDLNFVLELVAIL